MKIKLIKHINYLHTFLIQIELCLKNFKEVIRFLILVMENNLSLLQMILQKNENSMKENKRTDLSMHGMVVQQKIGTAY